MEIMTKALRGLLNRAKFAVEQKVVTITVDAATIASIAHELLEFRATVEEQRPSLDRLHAYVQKYGVMFTGQYVDETVLADAEHLRAELERRDAEIAALREALDAKAPEVEGVVYVDGHLWAVNLPEPDAAPVENAAAEPIKVGDKVRITAGTYEGLECRVTVVGILTATLITPDGKYMPIHVSRLEVIDG